LTQRLEYADQSEDEVMLSFEQELKNTRDLAELLHLQAATLTPSALSASLFPSSHCPNNSRTASSVSWASSPVPVDETRGKAFPTEAERGGGDHLHAGLEEEALEMGVNKCGYCFLSP